MDPPSELAPTPPATPTASAADYNAGGDDRRPRGHRRAREVSSRYMSLLKSPVNSSTSSSAASAPSPSASSSYCPPLPPKLPSKNRTHNHHLPQHSQNNHNHFRRPPSPSVDRRYPSSDSDEGGSTFADENRPESTAETPMPAVAGLQGKAAGTVHKKKAVVRLFRENGEEQQQLHLSDRSKVGGSVEFGDLRVLPRNPRPGTPMIPQPADRAANVSITPRPLLQSRAQAKQPSAKRPSTNRTTVRDSFEISTPARASSSVMEQDDDARSLGTASEASSLGGEFSEAEVCSIGGDQVGWCESPPIRAQGSRARGPPSECCRSSMPEVDQLPRISTKGLTDATRSNALDGPSSYRGTPSFCHRSLNSALSSCPQAKPLHKSSVKAHQNFTSQPPTPGLGVEPKKLRKPSGRREEDACALRLLENRSLQWRFVNAKAQVAAEARKIAAEKSLYCLSAKLLEMRDSVISKRVELQQLKQFRTLSTIVEDEMTHLNKWAVLEEDHSNSLSGTIKSLQDASLRLPLVGNIKADVMQLENAFESLINVVDTLAPRIGRFMPTAEGIGVHVSDLAFIVCKERALVEECGNMLSEVQRLQVLECSLRGQLMQLRQQSSSVQLKPS